MKVARIAEMLATQIGADECFALPNQTAARLAWKTLLWFCITALISVVIGMVLGVVIQPGFNF